VIIAGGVLMMASGVYLIGLGLPIGWVLAIMGLVAVLGGMYEKMNR
jgi:hypothetical protein